MSNLFFLCLWLTVAGQTPDVVRLEYTVVPENGFGIRTNRYRAVINVPFKLTENNYFITGFEYNRYEFEIDTELPFEYGTIERLHIVDMNLGYLFKLNSKWRGAGVITPRVASNFEQGIENNDFRLNGSVFFWTEKKDIERPYRLILGLSFNSATGLPYPLPLINYNRRFHPNWSYTLGVPRADLKYHIKDKHVFQTVLFLDGYFVNIQNDIILSDNTIGASVSLSALVAAIGYQFKFTKAISLYTLAGYTLAQEGLIRDGNRDRAFTLNDEGNFYLRTGFKISIF
ncbi:hypothetical protein FK220_000975 [Flavobacteriaceae bacterium TP-CH-4]|uniref:DUF6268 domain-containing protein n=1 Tax=Pelagihabitans pacificus TaxID=2696054 RepID=A0A967APJ3_9FLAO|nr:hypothetical protein [Pelagihabitans pacificus]